MKKRFLSTLLSAVMTASLLVGCGGGGGNTPATDTTDVQTTQTQEAEAEVKSLFSATVAVMV